MHCKSVSNEDPAACSLAFPAKVFLFLIISMYFNHVQPQFVPLTPYRSTSTALYPTSCPFFQKNKKSNSPPILTCGISLLEARALKKMVSSSPRACELVIALPARSGAHRPPPSPSRTTGLVFCRFCAGNHNCSVLLSLVSSHVQRRLFCSGAPHLWLLEYFT